MNWITEKLEEALTGATTATIYSIIVIVCLETFAGLAWAAIEAVRWLVH